MKLNPNLFGNPPTKWYLILCYHHITLYLTSNCTLFPVGIAQGAKKRQTTQRSAQKSSDRGSSKPNMRGNQAAPAIDINVKVEETPTARTNDTLQMNVAAISKGKAIEEIAKEVVVVDKVIDDSKGSTQGHVNGMMILTSSFSCFECRFQFFDFHRYELEVVEIQCQPWFACSTKLW